MWVITRSTPFAASTRILTQQILVLINGIPITNLFQGDRSEVWGGMPVEAIARIEVIRGPGSAVYGADAFAGVINIITKTKQDISGTEVGGRGGSFNTWDAWVLHGDTWGGFDVAATFEFHHTDGQRRFIDADAQTGSDRALGTNASLAPGPVPGSATILMRAWMSRVATGAYARACSGAAIGETAPASHKPWTLITDLRVTAGTWILPTIILRSLKTGM